MGDLMLISLQDALAMPGCPICRLGRRAASFYLDHLFYENVNDPAARVPLGLSLGFCSEHADEAARLGDALGVGIIYEDLVRLVIERLGNLQDQPGGQPGSAWWQGRRRAARRKTNLLLRPQSPCPACSSRDQAEERYCWALLKHIHTMLPALEASEGLCLRHLAACLEQTGFETEKAHLLEVEKGRLESLHLDLQELIRKFDYRYAREPKGVEAGSWKRALAKISGTNDLDSQEAAK